MHANPDLRVFLKWKIAGSGSVITDVIPLDYTLPMPEESKTPLPRFGLRALLVFTIIFGALVGLLAKSAMDYMNRPTPGELADQRERELFSEFVSTNPDTLDGWLVESGQETKSTLSWGRNGIAYIDTNGDGKPDTKRREWPIVSTTEVWWEDTDFDGFFDTEREQGCFHNISRLISPPVCIPILASKRQQTTGQ